MKQDMIVILDLGSTENTVVARQIRALGVYSEIHPHDITPEQLHALDNVKGIILNGGENRIVDGKAVEVDPSIYEQGFPVMAIDHPTAACEQKLDKLPDEETLKKYIKPCGFFNTKAKHILSVSRDLTEKYHGVVPNDREALQSLAGVGRKTASVVLSNAFNVPAIAVDTHVFRVSNRLGLACAANVEATEKQLMQCIPEEKWSIAHHWLIFHGRRVCSAQKPKCDICTLKELCKYHKENR